MNRETVKSMNLQYFSKSKALVAWRGCGCTIPRGQRKGRIKLDSCRVIEFLWVCLQPK